MLTVADGERRAVLDASGLTFYVGDKKAVSLHADPEGDGRTLTMYYADQVPGVVLGEGRPGTSMALHLLDEQQRDKHVIVTPELMSISTVGEATYLAPSQLSVSQGGSSAFFNSHMLHVKNPDGEARLTSTNLTVQGTNGRQAELSTQFEPFLHLRDTETSTWVTTQEAKRSER